jgi:RNA polymerase sigma factor (sigma-70 family)
MSSTAPIAEFEKLMGEVASGSEDAIWQLAQTYTPYIVRTVRLSLSPKLRSKLDSQDVAQTLWASLLLKRTELARLKTPQQLIAYLAKATKHKVIDAARHYRTQKHDITREQSLDKGEPADAHGGNQHNARNRLFSRETSPSTAASLRERFNSVLTNATERDRKILHLRLRGCTFATISLKLKIDERTARRAICALVDQLSQQL